MAQLKELQKVNFDHLIMGFCQKSYFKDVMEVNNVTKSCAAEIHLVFRKSSRCGSGSSGGGASGNRE